MKSGNEVKFSEVRCGKILRIASHHTPKKLVYFDFFVFFTKKEDGLGNDVLDLGS